MRLEPILLVSGGLPGAGKSTILAQQRELEPDRIPYVTVDPDDIRDRLFAQVLRPDGQHPALVDHPDLEGMPGGPPTPRELSSVFHAEAARIAVDHRRWLTTENVSFVYDTTMHSYDAVRVVAESAHRNEYEVSGIYVDVDRDTARERATSRWAQGLAAHDPEAARGSEEWLGGRYTPEWLTEGFFPEGSNEAVSRQTMERAADGPKAVLDRAQLYDGRAAGEPATLVQSWEHGEASVVGTTAGSDAGGQPGPMHTPKAKMAPFGERARGSVAEHNAGLAEDRARGQEPDRGFDR